MALDEEAVKMALDTDFRRACEILEIDPEKANEDEDLYAEVAFFL